MKNTVLAASLLALVSGMAQAADVPVKAVALVPAVPSWAGFYLGIHGGYGWNDDDFSRTIVQGAPQTGFRSHGWVVGGHAGYNWQYGYVVAGLEGDLSATRIKGSSDPVSGTFGGLAPVTTSLSTSIKYIGTTRARLGFATDGLGFSSMFYATAGAAWERFDESVSVIQPGSLTVSTTPTNLFGWVAGVGAEAKLLGSNWIGRLEYLHYDFGSAHLQFIAITPGLPSSADRGGSQTLDVVRAGLSYKFGGDAAIARY